MIRNSSVVGLVLLVMVTSGVHAQTRSPLTAATVTPSKGTVSTIFHFSVTYFGKTVPTTRDLCVDATVVPMETAGPGRDGGVVYTCSPKLTVGTHKYRFRFVGDGRTVLAPGPTVGDWYTGPTVYSADCVTISGYVRCGTTGLSGVEVSVSKAGGLVQKAITNSGGGFTIIGLPPATYTTKAVKAGYRMDPASKTEAIAKGVTRIYPFRATKL